MQLLEMLLGQGPLIHPVGSQKGIQAQAIALGGTITEISPEEAKKYAASDNYARAWELWKKKAK